MHPIYVKLVTVGAIALRSYSFGSIAVLGWMRYTLTSLQTSLLLLREALILTPLPLQGRGWGLGFSAVLHAIEKCYSFSITIWRSHSLISKLMVI